MPKIFPRLYWSLEYGQYVICAPQPGARFFGEQRLQSLPRQRFLSLIGHICPRIACNNDQGLTDNLQFRWDQ